MKIENLKESLEHTMNVYVNIFQTKHNLYFVGWVANQVGTIACLGDYFFSFEDIRTDLEKEVPKGIIFDWYDYNLDNPESKINYTSWLISKKVKG